MTQIDKIRSLIEPVIQGEDLVLYDLGFTSMEGQKCLQVVICRPDYSMDMDTCEKVSDQISTVLDEADILSDSYYLDVCSPGAERELKTEEQIRQSIGNYVHIELKDPKEGIDTLEGTLKEINGDEIVLEYREKTRLKQFKAKLDNLKKIRLAVQF